MGNDVSEKTFIPSSGSSGGAASYGNYSSSSIGNQGMPVFARPNNLIATSSALAPSIRPPSPTFRAKIQRPGISETSYVKPKKTITTKQDIQFFLESEGMARFMDFLMAVNSSISSKKISQVSPTANSQLIIDILKVLDTWISEFPPIEQPQRYGNMAFREWISCLENRSLELLASHLPSKYHPAIIELASYFSSGFGNGTRLDYGSGHELNFVLFLTCLDLIGFFEDSDFESIGLSIFPIYLDLVRKLQVVYKLEPAGSHGVWGLDDYQFISYIWGSAQFINHTHMKPKSFLNREIVSAYEKDYIFLSCIAFIHQMKTGPFHEHSPMLFDISGVPNWIKVNKGLVKMYIAEVLEKLPIVQHMEFGSLIPWEKS